MIAIIIPSRGLINSHTVERLLQCVPKGGVEFYFSHDNPIPDCFNEPIAEALAHGSKFFVIIEEDMQVPPDFLNEMLVGVKEGNEVVFYDYPLRTGHLERVTQEHHGVLLSGTGLVGLTREAVEKLFPLRTDMQFTLNPPTLLPNKEATIVYGQHDIYMWSRIHDLKIPYKQVGTTGHYNLIEYGKSGVNNGFHDIELLT